ncbi:lysozyme inhibitor LprI family protein [Paraburkholderia antibiotica]|uniref:DUF1311 domain-containing protein n=1 Tax=Paraburkholderia antibiotica TaxID=2728839 RepID=A0A7X9X859_9BURK|nr:lysozyme inhibitor LprI family protein [Paraburkholderia antibiotica]NML33284.1 DUF1311 domain-containing protein [Paraburkholderia antibiotica]
MHKIKPNYFCIAAGLSSAVFAAPTTSWQEKTLREECSAFSQAGMRDCLAKKAESSQKTLRQAEEKLAGTLSRWDEDNKYVDQAKAALVESNKKFAEYRETQCEFSASLSGGAAGNAHEMHHLACISELNNKRAEQLRDAVSDLPLK